MLSRPKTLQTPTNRFACARNAHLIAENIVDVCLANVLPEIERFKPCGILLTGSFARGEGSILEKPSGEKIVLGDIEFLTIFPKGQDLAQIRLALQHAVEVCEEELGKKFIDCPVEFTPACTTYLSRVPPSIFGLELTLHTRVVWGDPDLLTLLSPLTLSSIPKLDAFYLLCNRMVEQLQLWQRLQIQKDNISIVDLYQVVKLYLDMAGSLLIFFNRYEPSYELRSKAIENFNLSDELPEEFEFNLFQEEVVKAVRLKLNPTMETLRSILSFQDPFVLDAHLIMRKMSLASSFLLSLWEWEVKKMMGVQGFLSGEDLDRSVLGMSSMVEDCKIWLKWMRLAYLNKASLPFTTVLKGLKKGNPRILTYLAARQLYGSICSDHAFNAKKVKMRMPIDIVQEYTMKGLVDQVLDTWKMFIRTT